ncbi:MAG: hypothetical protein LQ338_001487 [Usnochroma carphineum]|nr:MAG: hypothetical protein LQ338_001487 [Usnochroma carphineum]
MDPAQGVKRRRTSPVKKKAKPAAKQGTSSNQADPLAVRTRQDDVPEEGIIEENEQTPRPSRQAPPLSTAPKFDAPNSAHTSSHDTASSHAETSSTNYRRSTSPRKARLEMTLAEVGVIPVEIGSDDFELPAAAQKLYRDLCQLQSRQGLLPLSIRDKARDEVGSDQSNLYSKQMDHAKTKHALDHVEIWKRVVYIRDAARECLNDDSPESTWNMEVHSPILRTALRGHWKSQEIWYKDLTTARISDKDLLPKVPGFPKSKMVDFGIVIQPRALSSLWRKILEKCKAQPYYTINQTGANHVCKVPIAISIEVKRAGGSEDEALVQLETWVTAHYNNLKVLLRSGASADVKLPILPLLQTQGHDWSLMIAEFKTEESLIILHRNIRLGSTNDILGIYQIIASLRRLAQWVSEEYRPWWTAAVLGGDNL